MKCIIIGGGIGGLATAIALKKVGVDVRVFEQAPEIREVGAGLSIWSNAILVLHKLGVADKVIQQGSAFRYAKSFTHEGKLISSYDLFSINSKIPCVMVYRSDLQQALLNEVGSENVVTNARCISISQSVVEATATFEDGKSESADFLIGADGIHSVVRSQLFGKEEPRYSGFTCWRAILESDVQELPAETTSLILGNGFQSGIFRCGPNRMYWFLSVKADANGKDPLTGTKQFLIDKFAGPGVSPLLATALHQTDETRIFRNDLSDRPPVSDWGKGRVSLLGDSVHSTTPNLGQGACQAMESAIFLAASVKGTTDINTALRNYEDRRRKRTAMVSKQSRQTGMFLGITNPILRKIRNAMMGSFIGKSQMNHTFKQLLNYELPDLD